MFVGREEELKILNDMFDRKNGSACAIYGRRRVGKTSLVDRFCIGKRTIRIPFIKSNEEHNVSIMMSEISKMTGKKYPDVDRFEKALTYLSEAMTVEKTVIFMDEFPYLVERAPYVPSMLQHFIDHDLKESDSLLIVCGSSISMMKDQVENKDMPLYGRFMNRIVLRPLPYWECEHLHPDTDRYDSLKIYMTVGGCPAYHEMMHQKTYRECIIRNFLGPNALLSEEGSVAISREFRECDIMESLLMDISGGTVNIKELAEKEKMSPTMCGRYLSELEKMEIIETLTPMGDANKKTKVFRIRDPLIGFCHGVIGKNNNIASSPNREEAFDALMNSIDTFIGLRFEDICMEYMNRKFLCRKMGKWWGWTGEEIAEIDIVAETTDGVNEIEYIAECKFTRKPMGISILHRLQEKSGFMRSQNNRRYILFSASGFTDDLLEFSENRVDISLVDLDGLFDF